MTSHGACIESTGTPQSITFMAYLAHSQAMVPPPPMSTLPSSLVCQQTFASSITRRTAAMNSALASLAPLLPREPVYLLKHTPMPSMAVFFFSNTLG